MDCGCIVVITIGDPEIEFCPMHQAALQMLEALKWITEYIDRGARINNPMMGIHITKVVRPLVDRLAIAAAEPKKE